MCRSNIAQAHAVLAVSAADGPGVVRWVGLQNPVGLTLNLAPASHGWVTLGKRFDLSEPQFSHLSNSSYKSSVIKVSIDHRQEEQTCSCQGGESGEGKDWKSQVSR